MAKPFRTFRFDLQVYVAFKDLASKNGYTVTAALEKFMADAVKFGLVFPSSQNAVAKAFSILSRADLLRVNIRFESG